MSRIPRLKSKIGFYHIMLRGNERRNIFNDETDRLKFIETIKEAKQETRFHIHAYCLMDNHIHLMLREGTEDIATVMKRITVRYVSYFNKKYKRVGHLFQDRYKSEIVEDERYALNLARYIHQNPVRAGMINMIDNYKWSSYHCYFEENPDIVDTGTILGIFATDKRKALHEFAKYMKMDTQETFLDLETEEMDEEAARDLLKRMAESGGNSLSDKQIKEFRILTNLSIRKIAEISGINKDRIHKILKS